jgi:hypothetical protein
MHRTQQCLCVVAEAESNEEDHNGQLEQSAPIGFFQNAAKGCVRTCGACMLALSM